MFDFESDCPFPIRLFPSVLAGDSQAKLVQIRYVFPRNEVKVVKYLTPCPVPGMADVFAFNRYPGLFACPGVSAPSGDCRAKLRYPLDFLIGQWFQHRLAPFLV